VQRNGAGEPNNSDQCDRNAFVGVPLAEEPGAAVQGQPEGAEAHHAIGRVPARAFSSNSVHQRREDERQRAD